MMLLILLNKLVLMKVHCALIDGCSVCVAPPLYNHVQAEYHKGRV